MRGATLASVALLAFLPLHGCSEAQSTTENKAEPVPVAIMAAGEAAPPTDRLLTGTVRARREIVMGFKTAGRVSNVLVEEGQQVAAGQLLAALDPTETGAGVAVAEAELTRAEAHAERVRNLSARGWATRAQLEASEAALAQARAGVSASRFELELGNLVAASSGVVLARHAEPGQIMVPGEPVLTVADGRGGWALTVPMTDIDVTEVELGQLFDVVLPGAAFSATGRVVEIARQADAATGLFDVEVLLPDNPRLRTGLVGSIRWRRALANGAMTLPPSAVFNARADEGFVYVLEGATARLRKVRLGAPGEHGVIVTAGLGRGEQVIVSGADRLSDGTAVRVKARR